ncbi:MAG: hypothetical protein CO150_09250 [Nitrospirae bacterium CG_4_9_14_3_um_filter_53_35]|nr:MAG: hypothetical protein COW52_02580 [Nitrospirae bacterium CG17_big_fil_post_rev_8_21_14_2_50_50_9]PIW85491.1 MAG: hypothetical protein COZ95_04250 [Nitrospirae bacterium CG_4_8_14_3_um_filter_50_41]PIX86296.1 MAG: hypothetical protein COZ32_04065 [Nitrospirae bacterium CG_4_10_14_3_um_filter_53_41]PJA72975.1 MAG: hypothetical protein CO150_09250 [Nitrospirae bacterium CG_4_9_14_3_um_filter_53_35]
MTRLKPHPEILTEAQQAIWPEMKDMPDDFVLYGGTALALRLGHRISVDFDFFSKRGFTPDELERQIPFLKRAERIQSKTDTLVCLVDRGGFVKASFFGGLNMRRVADPDRVKGPGFFVASLLDAAATKIKVVQDRAEAKDYQDIAAILKAGLDLPAVLSAAKAVYGEPFNPFLSLKALSYFGDGDLSTLSDPIQSFLISEVRKVDIKKIPEISFLPGGLTPVGT